MYIVLHHSVDHKHRKNVMLGVGCLNGLFQVGVTYTVICNSGSPCV